MGRCATQEARPVVAAVVWLQWKEQWAARQTGPQTEEGAVRCGAVRWVAGAGERGASPDGSGRKQLAGGRAGWQTDGLAGWQFVVALARRKGESAWLCSGTSAFSSARCELVSAGGCRRAGRLGDRVVGRQS